MNDISQSLFGPLTREYCIWFYFLSLFGFIALVLFLVPAIFFGISKRKGAEYYISIFGISVIYVVAYFQNRLLYTMCSSSVK